MSKAGDIVGVKRLNFRDYNKPKKRAKPKASKKRLPKTAKGFKK
tara:strand:- start:1184 stop:1315 length:132 start_codon:yes stop_codon:yes gene_type:complete